ncbi:MAG: ATP-binding cassette domain-containing protein [Dehalococcoidales bacterium]|nr:ATP-binding cassette domain-containing protein [Dehalococcoidales bacterium]
MVGNAVAVENLVKVYPRVKAVDDISFNVPETEIFGLLGPNGAGKSTIIRTLLTLIKPTSGRISIFGVNALTHPEKAREMAGYVPQDISVDGELTGYENILMYSKLYGVPGKEREKRIKEVLEYLELEDRANDMVSTYSGGMMRRLEIAQALVNRPRILFLDEPSIGLDPSARRAIWDLVKRLREEFKATIFLTTHDMNEADVLCDRIGIIDKGKLIIDGSPAQSVMFVAIFYGITVVWERDLGLLNKLLSTPTPRSAIVLGKALSAGVRGIFQAIAVLLLALIIRVHLQLNVLSVLGVFGIIVLFGMCFSSLSMSLAPIFRTRERMMGIGQAITMPLFFASNAIYPIALMPA